MDARDNNRARSDRHRDVETQEKAVNTTVSVFFIVTKCRQGGRVFRKMNGRWTRNRFHSELAVYHSRATADVVAYSENATVVEC